MVNMDTDDVSLDDNEMGEYHEMIKELGTFPDKVLINALTMVAEDHADSKESARKVYECIRNQLLAARGDHILPVMYVLDSILKNARGYYIQLFTNDATEWMRSVYLSLPNEATRAKLKKVYKTWSDFNLFPLDVWNAVGECLNDDNINDTRINVVASSSGTVGGTIVAGIPRAASGDLMIKPALRKEMQKVLDELQNDIEDELEKVSLERLADINPDLLANIKKAAEDAMNTTTQSASNGGTSSVEGSGNKNESVPARPSFLVEFRTDEALSRSLAWSKLDLKHAEQSKDIVQKLQASIAEGSSADSRYTKSDAIDMTHVLASASTAIELLSKALEHSDNQHKSSSSQKGTSSFSAPGGRNTGSAASGYSSVDKSLFTNNGIKKKNLALIGLLYEVGLPFISSADGRRFKSQLELSQHLDRLFKKSQIEKSMARTEERGWYVSDSVWTGEKSEEEADKAISASAVESAGSMGMEEGEDPDSFTEIADEERNKCVICGINYKMFFDNEDGAYKYKNCREIEVMNDDTAVNESDMMLVHVTCWKGLGSPETLDIDQTLHE